MVFLILWHMAIYPRASCKGQDEEQGICRTLACWSIHVATCKLHELTGPKSGRPMVLQQLST